MKFAFAPETRPLPGYTIKRAIDRGGFGEVYYALSDSGKEVALKLLHENESIELRGVTQCLNLKHPNLVTLYDLKTDADGDHWVVMEYMAQPSLEHVLATHPNGLPAADVEMWLAGMCAGAEFLHERGLVHRDLKPANVFCESGVVKIGDVGLSKFIAPSRRSAHTESVGTVYYMAPEVARGRYGREVDVYSLGIMLFEMLTGRVPFQGESTAEILMKHLTEAPRLEPVAPALRPVLARALEKDPLKRISTPARLLAEYRAALLPSGAASAQPVSPTAGASPTPGASAAVEIPPESFVELRPAGEDRSRKPRPRGCKPWSPIGWGCCGPSPFAGSFWNGPCGPRHNRRQQASSARPVPASPVRRHAVSASVHHQHARFLRQPWFWVALVAGLIVWSHLAHAGPHPLRLRPGMIFAIVLLGSTAVAAYYAVTWLVEQFREAFVSHAPPLPPALHQPSFTPPVLAAASPNQTAPPLPRRRVVLTPETPRQIPFFDRIGQLATSYCWAAAWTAVMTLAVGFFTPLLGDLAVASPETLGRWGAFSLVSLLASWSLLTLGKFSEGTPLPTGSRRLQYAVLGLAVGAAAWGITQTLFVHMNYDSLLGRSILVSIGRQPLIDADTQPTLLAFSLFFGALFGARRWWWQCDSFRANPFRWSSLLLTTGLAFLLPALFAFPQLWAVSWAAAISAVVQLSAGWMHPEVRAAWLENRS